MKQIRLITAIALLAVCTPHLHAAAALFLEEPFGGFGEMNPTGHAAVYLSNVCVESPTVLRRCQPGETGVVISRYHHVAGYDWIAIPLIPYLYAVNDASEVPASVDPSIVAQMRDAYRREHLEALIPDGTEGAAPGGEWIQLLGSSYDRKIYAFEIETTQAQDDELINMLNSQKNRAHFNLFFRNCADFSRSILNTIYPKAVHRSFVADAGITTPKEIAKTLTGYSKHHSDLWFTEFEIPQVAGSVHRSKPVRGVCESLLRSKKYAVPLIVLHPWIGASVAAAYVTRGRFNPEHHAVKLKGAPDVERELVGADPRNRQAHLDGLRVEEIEWPQNAQVSSPRITAPAANLLP